MILPRPLSPTIETSSGFTRKVTMIPQNAVLEIPPATTKVPPARRRVRFSADENDSQSAPHKELTSEMKSDMWYTSNEMTGFKREAESIIIQQYRQGRKLASEDALGLERYEPKRDEFRRQAIYYTLQAQKKSMDPDFIRMISRKCTAYSRAVATHQGLMDHSAAYNPLYSLDTQGKRQRQQHDEEPRSKKQRTAPVA